MAAHSFIINAWSLSEFVGFTLFTCLLSIDHKISIGLRSGKFLGHGRKILMIFFPSHLVITSAYGKVLHHHQRMHVQDNFRVGTALHL